MPTVAELYQQILGRAPESQAVIDAWTQMFGAEIDPSEVSMFQQAAAPEIAARAQQRTPVGDPGAGAAIAGTGTYDPSYTGVRDPGYDQYVNSGLNAIAAAPTAQTNTLSSLANAAPVTTAQPTTQTYAPIPVGNNDAAMRWVASLPAAERALIEKSAALNQAKQNAENTSSRLGAQMGARKFRELGGQAAYDAAAAEIAANPGLSKAIKDFHAAGGGRTGGLGQGTTELLMLAAAATAGTLGGLGGLGGASSGATAASAGGTVGDMAAMYEASFGMSAADAMAAAEAAMASGTTATSLAATLAEAGMMTGSEIVALTGNSALGQSVNSIVGNLATQTPAGTSATVGGAGGGATAAGGTVGGGNVLDASGNVVGTGGTLTGTGGLLGTGITGTQLASTGLDLLGNYIGGQTATDAAQTSANAQIEAARIAADAAKFRPVGVTTRFGQSQFGYDQQGNLTTAGYTLTPEMRAQQDALMGVSNQALTQYQGAQAATAPIGQGAQTLFGLGQGYLATTPQQQAAKYMADQQALLAAPRADQLSALQNQMNQQGRTGLAVGGNAGMMAANPEMAAYYNAIAQQDLGLAAQATQGGQQYATFGAGLLGTGSDLLNSMYGTQTAAYNPYATALGGATQIEGLGQQAMDYGTAIGARTSTAAANAGAIRAQGMTNAANTMQPANAYSPWGALLTGAGRAIGQYGQPQQQPAQTTTFAPQANYWSI